MSPNTHPFIDDMRHILASRIKEKDPKSSESATELLLQKSLKELYRLAWSKIPALHCDFELGRVFKNAMEDRRAREAWVKEGMSPLIFFAWKADGESISKPAWIGLSRLDFELSRDQLLGNLKPFEFMAFLRDAVALSGINYQDVVKICTLLPDLLKPSLFHHAQWEANILSKAFWRGRNNTLKRKERLGNWIPLLIVTLGGSDNDFYLAKNVFRIHDSVDVKRLTAEALYNSQLPGGHDGLMRFVELQFKNWTDFTLDESLREALAGSGILSVENAHFWVEQAADTIKSMRDGDNLAWPASVYAAVYHHFCNEDSDQSENERRDSHRLMMEVFARLYEIRKYIDAKSGYTLQRALLGSYRELDLMSKEMISFLSPEAKSQHAQAIAPFLSASITKKIKAMDFGFDEPWKIIRQLEDADSQCSSAIVNHAHSKFAWSELPSNLSSEVVENLLHFTLHDLAAQSTAGDTSAAVAWCSSVRSKKWRPVVMRVLHLSPADVSLSPAQREAFLAEDLGL